jgi:hypothetical protein
MKASKPQKLVSNIERRNMHHLYTHRYKLTVEFDAADHRPSRRGVRKKRGVRVEEGQDRLGQQR